jgi:hypothetical protein
MTIQKVPMTNIWRNAIFYKRSFGFTLSKNFNKDPGLEHIVRTGLNQWLGGKNIGADLLRE